MDVHVISPVLQKEKWGQKQVTHKRSCTARGNYETPISRFILHPLDKADFSESYISSEVTNLGTDLRLQMKLPGEIRSMWDHKSLSDLIIGNDATNTMISAVCIQMFSSSPIMS